MAEFALRELWQQRCELFEFKMRDVAYKVYEDSYLARDRDKKSQYITWRPIATDGSYSGDSVKERQMINLSRQVVNHHQASFARVPKLWNVAYSPEGVHQAEQATNWLHGVLRRSRMKNQQAQQSFYISALGDACYGVEWDEAKKTISAKSYNPSFCYPDLDQEDPSRMHDLLITYEVRSHWAERVYPRLAGKLGDRKTVRMFIFWDSEQRLIAIEDFQVDQVEHSLGFVPWVWASASPNGHFAQSDIAETPKLQQLVCDILLLALDATRKRVDKAYWGAGLPAGQNITPQPGKVLGFPNPQAHINEFPTADPPDMLFSVMSMLTQHALSMAGISPISAEGMATGSIVTGAAVRHQVEAIEARAETKRVSLENAFAMLGEYLLRVLEAKFPETEVVMATEKGPVGMKGADVHQWYTCEASYGGFESLALLERGRWALEGIGRLHDDHKAVEIVYPDEDPAVMVAKIRDFQLRQAAITGQSQAAAQQAVQGPQTAQAGVGSAGGQPAANGAGGTASGGPGGLRAGPQTMGPRVNPRPEPPGMPQVAAAGGQPVVTMTELQSLLNLVRDELHGGVFAIGELAVAGQSTRPRVAVEDERDLGKVRAALASKKVEVEVGVPDGPKASLL